MWRTWGGILASYNCYRLSTSSKGDLPYMKTGNAKAVKQSGGGGAGPIGGWGSGPIGGGGGAPVADGGSGPIGGEPVGGGPRAKAILQQIAKHFGPLSKAFDDLANTPFGGVPSPKGTAKKK